MIFYLPPSEQLVRGGFIRTHVHIDEEGFRNPTQNSDNFEIILLGGSIMAEPLYGFSQNDKYKIMRILLISPQPLYGERGSTIAVYEELKVLSALGYNVDVATYPLGKDINISGVRLIRIANPFRFKSVKIGFSLKKIIFDIILFVKVLCLVRKKHYNCIHGVEEGAGIALLCKIFSRIPVIYDMHSSISEQLRDIKSFRAGPGRWLAILLDKLLLRNADAILATKGLAFIVLNVVPQKFVREYCFDGLCFEQAAKNIKRSFTSNSIPVVVYAGNFSNYQGLELLLEAARQLYLTITNVKFILAGGTESAIIHLANIIKQYQLEKVVNLYPQVSRSEVADILMQADVLVLPRPRGENVPLKMYDYIKSGKPIVATNIPAHTAILSEKTAFLVKPTAEALANGLKQVLQNLQCAERVALEAKVIAETDTRNTLRSAIIETYQHVLSLEK